MIGQISSISIHFSHVGRVVGPRGWILQNWTFPEANLNQFYMHLLHPQSQICTITTNLQWTIVAVLPNLLKKISTINQILIYSKFQNCMGFPSHHPPTSTPRFGYPRPVDRWLKWFRLQGGNSMRQRIAKGLGVPDFFWWKQDKDTVDG